MEHESALEELDVSANQLNRPAAVALAKTVAKLPAFK
jgi:hypothetical protein